MKLLPLRVVAALGLAYDAYVHLHLASTYDAVRSSTISQGQLFRVEAVVAIVTAVLVVALRRRSTDVAALLVAAGGLAVVLLYRYVDLGAVGPLPAMYEPSWYQEKSLSAVAEGIAALSALVSLAAPLVLARLRPSAAAPRPVPVRSS